MADLVEHDAGPVAVLHAGGMDDDPQRKAFDVDQGVELATLHPLAGVITHCVVFTPVFAPPFSAAFSDWLSMMAAVGKPVDPLLARRPQATPPKSAPTRRRGLSRQFEGHRSVAVAVNDEGWNVDALQRSATAVMQARRDDE